MFAGWEGGDDEDDGDETDEEEEEDMHVRICSEEMQIYIIQ